MPFTVFGLGLFGLLFLWGAGFAALALPRRWMRHWPVFAPLFGVAAIAAVVWIGARIDLPGTAACAAWTWVAPGAAAVAAFLRRTLWREGWRRAACMVLRDTGRHAGVLAVALATLLAATRAMDEASRSLTSFSAGSCDAADYAAGARVLRDFAVSDRTGHLGNREVVALHSVESFPDHWLRLNHFAPAAVIAWWSAATGMPVHELATLAGAVFLAAMVPLAFWVGRALIGAAAGPSLLLAAAFGTSGTQIYAVAQTALGQLIAAGGVVLLTWAGMRAWHEGGSWRGALRWVPAGAAAAWVLLGAYNFMLPLAPAALAGWMAVRFMRERDAARLGRVGAAGAAAAALAGLFAPARVAGLGERFALLAEHDFGWPVPVFTPERWFGWFGNLDLGAAGGAAPWIVGGAFLAAAVVHAADGRRRVSAWAAAALALFPMIGYAWLAAAAARAGGNASYDAYKFFAVFHPLILGGFCGWLRWTRRSGGRRRAAWAGGFALLAAHLAGAGPVRAGLAHPRLRLERETLELRRIEGMDDVPSLDMVLEPFWDRLWANALLLRKPQYFRTYTYEGRRPTATRGVWELRDRSISVRTGDAGERPINGRYQLLRRGPRFVEAAPGAGWHAPERLGPAQWMWAAGAAAIRVGNPHAYPLIGSMRGRFRAVAPQRVAVRVRGGGVWSGPVGLDEGPFATAAFALPPGETVIEIVPESGPARAPGDTRDLSVAAYDLEIVVEGGPEAGP